MVKTAIFGLYKMKKHIPNIITLGNLTCGLLAIVSVFNETFVLAGYLILLALVFDFADGFAARMLKVQSDLGKQLDSLADMVTFGVAPGILIFFILKLPFTEGSYFEKNILGFHHVSSESLNSFWRLVIDYGIYLVFLIPLMSAIRLAKFNLDESQSDQFKGLPTPASAALFASIGMVYFDFIGITNSPFDWKQSGFIINENQLLVITGLVLIVTILISFLLVSQIPLIALKFKTFGWKGNEVRFVFLGLCLVTILLALLISNVFVAVPIIILLYLIISIINNITKRKNEIQSKH